MLGPGSEVRAGGATGDGAATDPLFAPLQIGNLTLKNRIVMPPMGTGLDDHGAMNDASIAYYRRRATGGTGVITIEALLVDPETRGPEPRIYADEYLPGLTRTADECREAGAVVGAQLLHPGRQVLAGRHVAPSAIPINSAAPVPQALTVAEIEAIVEFYAAGAERAQRAGFDFVEVHGAHGYLASDFLSPLANQRDDAYGGTLENRARFSLEIARAIKARCPELPLFWRISGEEALPGGTTVEDAAQVSRWLEAAGVDCLSVSAGHWRSLHVTLAPMWVPRGYLVRLAAHIRKEVSVPVMAVGRLDDPADARRVLTDGDADLIAIGRGLIADPDWANKVREGRDPEIRPCIACNACVDLVGPGGEVRCAVNPQVGREHTWDPRPAAEPKRVAVVGSGPAGLSAATIARERGHDVTLFERDARIGGKLVAAASAPSKHEVLRFRDFEEREVARLGVHVETGVEVDGATLDRFAADTVVLAVGAGALLPPIPGLDGPTVHDAQDYLRGARVAEAGSTVAVIGGSATGCETAELLVEHGVHVTILEMATSIGAGIEAITRRHIVKQLKAGGATVLTGAKVVEVTPTEVFYERDGVRESVPAAAVALAIGWKPRGSALADLIDHGDVRLVGDAVRPADFVAAVNAGADLGLEL
ncbi:MAG: FAD-dependent oxidoreductase [Solirubrobacteraceae bacterium]|nr:FAD-dependent oxidoreductase [Patulibacter sp.]